LARGRTAVCTVDARLDGPEVAEGSKSRIAVRVELDGRPPQFLYGRHECPGIIRVIPGGVLDHDASMQSLVAANHCVFRAQCSIVCRARGVHQPGTTSAPSALAIRANRRTFRNRSGNRRSRNSYAIATERLIQSVMMSRGVLRSNEERLPDLVEPRMGVLAISLKAPGSAPTGPRSGCALAR
jgi:hypothetical protein